MKITLGELISVSTGRLTCEMERVYAVLNFLTGDSLFTHQLPRAFHHCAPILKQRFPFLAVVDPGQITPETWRDWLENAKLAFGDEFEIEPWGVESWIVKGPLTELAEMMGEREDA